MPTLVRHKSGIYYLVYSHEGKRVWRTLRTRDTRTAYEAYRKEDGLPNASSAITLPKAQEEFLAYVVTNLSKGALDVYRNAFSQFNKFLSDRLVREITPHDIDTYRVWWAKSVSTSTVNHDFRQLKAIFNKLVLWGYLQKNPCQRMKEIRQIERIPLFLSKEDHAKLLEFTKGAELHDIILLGAMTGLRKGELLNLTWNDVDLVHGTLIVRSSITYRTKCGKIRSLPLNKTARNLLEHLVRRSERLFPGDKGGEYNHDLLSRRFKKI
jgi:integrase